MSRSGYSEDYDDTDGPFYLLWPSIVRRSIKGQRGQSFLRSLAQEMDAMPEKILIADELIDAEGNCCTMGVICKARGLDVSKVDYDDPEEVAKLLHIAPTLARQISYQNDDDFQQEASHGQNGIQGMNSETPEQRWVRMRKWVEEQLKK